MILPFVGHQADRPRGAQPARRLSVRGRHRILLGMAAGVGKTYRMLQEGRQARDEGRDVVIGYLEPHDRPETAALADGLEQVPRLRSAHGGLELEEMDVDAVIRREPELALVDELAHTNVPEARNRKRYEDIDELLDAGDRRHLDRQRPAPREPQRLGLRADGRARPRDVPRPRPRRGRRGRARRPHARGAAGAAARRQGLPRRPGRARRCRTSSGIDNLAALRELVLRELAEDVEAQTAHDGARPAQPAGGRRADPRARHARAALAARAAPRVPLGRSGSAPRSTRSGCAGPGAELTEQEAVSLAALRRLASMLGTHFLEVEGDDLAALVKAGRARARLDLRLRRHARRVAADARSCAARSSRSSFASCPGSTSASSPTARCARRSRRDVLARSGAHRGGARARRRRRRALPAPAAHRAARPRGADPRAVHRRRARPDRARRPRSGSRAPRTRRSSPPT